MANSENLISLPVENFIRFLKNEKIDRFYFVYDKKTNSVKTSHEQLQSIANFLISDKRDFETHEGLFFELNTKYDTLLCAFIHRTNRGQGAGGTRYWNYDKVEDFIRDGLRLSKGMTHKNALAGLWWGGGKGIIVQNPKIDKYDEKTREAIYKSYGEFMTSLNGCYVTAEDVGTNVTDMANIFSKTRFTTCIPPELGGSGNPSVPTARGVVSGMEAALKFLNNETLEGKRVAVQGAGNVGSPLIEFLFERNVKKVITADINEKNINAVKKRFAGKNLEASVVGKNDDSILFTECDILAPCATGAIINEKTIPNIKANIICGAANNQLEDSERDGKELLKRNILYVPDFLTNRMGIVNCANEQYGYVDNDDAINQHFNKKWNHSIYNIATEVFETSKKENIPTSEVAVKLADKLSLENHPIFGHRGEKIIDSLVKNEWNLK